MRHGGAYTPSTFSARRLGNFILVHIHCSIMMKTLGFAAVIKCIFCLFAINVNVVF